MTPPLAIRCPCGCDAELSPMAKFAPYRTCPICGTGYFLPVELQGTYYAGGTEPADWQWAAWGARQHQWRWAFDACGVPAGGQVLDVGSGWGHLVEWAVGEGYDATGVETDAWARERTLVPDRIAPALPAAGEFDLITLFDVLEHVVEPLAFAATLVPLLAPGGRLLVAGPCFDAIRAKWDLYRRREASFAANVRPTEHVSQFTAQGQRWLLERAGCRGVTRLQAPLNRHHNRATATLVRVVPVLRDSMFLVGTAA